MYYLVFFVIIFVGAEAFLFSSIPDNSPVDCVWTAWRPQDCVNGNDPLRYKIPARNGGKDCVGDSRSEGAPCTPVQFVAQNFMKTFSQADISQGNYGLGRSMPEEVCPATYADPAMKYKMSGRGGCSNRRKKRTVHQTKVLHKISLNLKPARSLKQTRDVLFLLDESGSVGKTNFQKVLRFAKVLVSKLCNEIKIRPGHTKIALLSFDTDVHVHMKFDDYTSPEGVLPAIDRVSYNASSAGRTCLVNALNYTRHSMFTELRGARTANKAHDMVILVTDGCANCDGNLDVHLQAEVQAFDQQKSTFMLVTVGDKTGCAAKISALKGNHCYLNFEMSDWESFKTFVDNLEKSDCIPEWKTPDTECEVM